MELPPFLASIHDVLKDSPVLFFFIVHMSVGRTVSVLTGVMLLRISPLPLMGYALIGDLLNIPFFVALYEGIRKSVRRSKRIGCWLDRNREKRQQGGLYGRLAKLGPCGVIVLAALPMYGCGMWSSILLAWSMNMKPVRGTVYLAAGSVVGSIVALALAIGIRELIRLL
jgi:uncharacterized membrane protein